MAQEKKLKSLIFFRLYMSSKMGRSDSLDICLNNDDLSKFNGSKKEIFLKSLVLNVHLSSKIHYYGKVDSDRVAMKVKPQVKNFATNSDFPEFDEQVLNLIKPYGSIRNIKYYANEDTGFPVLVFNLSGYRYCQNIKGAHFSNNVYFEQIFVNAFCIKNAMIAFNILVE